MQVAWLALLQLAVLGLLQPRGHSYRDRTETAKADGLMSAKPKAPTPRNSTTLGPEFSPRLLTVAVILSRGLHASTF